MPALIEEKKVGNVRITKEIVKWRECEVCGLPAVWRVTYLVAGNCRANPASSAYRKDDCSWCWDYETFACRRHKEELIRNPPNGYTWCTAFPLAKFKHMGFYWKRVEENKSDNQS